MSLEVREMTPRGSGAISVIRVRGAHALETVRSIARRGPRLEPGGPPRVVSIGFGGEELDEAVVCAISADEVEIHLHGSPPLVARVVQRLRGAGEATPTPRTIEERARELLADAPCEAAARILLDQAEGALQRELACLRTLRGEAARAAADVLLERARIARFVLEPAEVVLAGPVNAGKSTLFNVLLGERRAIVSAAAGTTRDLVRERALLGAYPVELVDSAGERASAETAVEAAGQARGRAARRAADLVLWLEPAASARWARGAREQRTDGRVEQLRTFADLCPAPGAISAAKEPEAARAHVEALFRRTFRLPLDPWTPGAGVPFTPELAAAVADAAALP